MADASPENSPLALTNPDEIALIAQAIDFGDPALTITYGAKAMRDIAGFSDSVLKSVRAKDAGPIGEQLTELLVKVRSIDIDQINARPGFLERLPVVGALFRTVERTTAQFDTLLEQVEKISAKLDDASVSLLRDIELLEQLFGTNRGFHADLSAHIEAGKAKLEEAQSQTLPALQKKAENGDGMTAQEVRDFKDRLDRFERRLHDLQLSRAITLQTAPQIRLIQNNDQTLAEKIQTSILSTIPIWKSQMVLALSLHKQRQAVGLQKDVADATNAMLRRNAEMLESSTIEAAREVERSIVDMETLRDVQARLLHTIEETLSISDEARKHRAEAEKELGAMEQELRRKLTSMTEDENSRKAVLIRHAPDDFNAS
ncbi:tellurite resistance protein [Alphaproteobacteria bacterium]|nr:tellurite resistance protein [Alphaproteobacteria bacterium]